LEQSASHLWLLSLVEQSHLLIQHLCLLDTHLLCSGPAAEPSWGTHLGAGGNHCLIVYVFTTGSAWTYQTYKHYAKIQCHNNIEYMCIHWLLQ